MALRTLTESSLSAAVILLIIGLVMSVNNSPSSVTTCISANPAHQRLLALDSPARATALGVMVNSSSSYLCKGKDAFFQGLDPKDNVAFWSVRCTNGKSYQVSIEANAKGSTRV